jgi:potassium-dependent mechanosensitive channel
VPNGNLLSGNLINWTLNNTNRRIDLDVGVSYSADPPAVQLLLAQVARTIPGISALPEPAVIFLRFNSSSLDFGIRAWTSDFDSWRSIQSALGVAVHRALKEAGIEIPFPQQDLHLRSVDVEARVRLAKLSQEANAAAKPDSTGQPASS